MSVKSQTEGQPSKQLPSHAEYIVVGGGIIGLSVAYHLTCLGHRDVLLLERKQLTCGTTWHAAGLVTQLRATENMARLAQYTAQLFPVLERETGQSTGFVQTGSISLATSEDRLEELRRGASMGRGFGLTVEIIDADEVLRRVPLLNVDDVTGAAWIPTDGKVNPVDAARAFEIAAARRGANIIGNVAVEDVVVSGRRIRSVITEHGEIRCERLALCTGMWSLEFGRALGLTIPLHAAEHFYLVTEPVEGLRADCPTVRDLDGCFYAKEDAGRLLVGAFEPRSKPWGMAGIPADFSFDQLPEDFDHLEPITKSAIKRIPSLEHTGIQVLFNGPESFTPDNRFLLGPAPEIDGVFVAAGFNSCGIESSGGAGKVLAEWMCAGRPDADYWEIDLRRAMPFQSNRRYLHDRTVESVGMLYGLHTPHRTAVTARAVRLSALHDRLLKQGAVFGEAAGWERPSWFRRSAAAPDEKCTFGKDEWFRCTEYEHLATRSHVGIFDQSSFAHLLVQGPEALSVLQKISCNDVDVPAGKVVYTPWLNDAGGMESDVTITRLGPNEFLVVTAAVQKVRDLAWLRRAIATTNAFATVTDVSSAYATVAIMGPNARDLLQRTTAENVSNSGLPFGWAREIDVGYGKALAMRITFVGEPGFELHVPTEFAVHVYDTLVRSADGLGLAHCGYFAIESLRMESGYRDWGQDVSAGDTPLEAGLGFTVAWDKPGAFNGRRTLLSQRHSALRKRLVQFALEDPHLLLFGGEPVFADGRLVGHLKSAAYGHSIGAALGMGYLHHEEGVTQDWLASLAFEVEVATRRVAAHARLRPFHDPDRTKVRS